MGEAGDTPEQYIGVIDDPISIPIPDITQPTINWANFLYDYLIIEPTTQNRANKTKKFDFQLRLI